jgi:hypothetical protein
MLLCDGTSIFEGLEEKRAFSLPVERGLIETGLYKLMEPPLPQEPRSVSEYPLLIVEWNEHPSNLEFWNRNYRSESQPVTGVLSIHDKSLGPKNV